MKKRLFASLLIALLLPGLIGIFLPGKANAAFNATRIIDDSVFNNSMSMSAGAIDNFLNSFSGSCISTNSGFKAILPVGYSPSTSYKYGDFASAGSVIAAAAQAYDLNPQVLLVTLQKEQSLVTGGGGCDTRTIAKAMGYGCPDSANGPYSYSGVNLYWRNGTTYTSVNDICVNSAAKAGFSQQVIRAAWLLKFAQQRSMGNIGWAIIRGNWDNSDDPQSCYSGPMTEGIRRICPSGSSSYFDGLRTIDGQPVYISNGATAALYWYTPHFHGNQNFYNRFTDWFGSTSSQLANSSYVKAAWSSPCNIPVYGSDRVGRMYNPESQDYFYTTNREEACIAMRFGYIWDGQVFQNIVSTAPNAIPVYRIANPGRHLYTTSLDLRNEYLTNNGYHDEGIAFYAYSTAKADTLSTYCLVKDSTVLYTSAGAEKNGFEQAGFSNAGLAFHSPKIGTETAQVYRMNQGAHRFYTKSMLEKDIAKSLGFNEEQNGFSSKVWPDTDALPVYRISAPGRHFYTTNRGERDMAIVFWGYISEGTEFYAVDSGSSGSKAIHRLTDYYGNRVFTPSASERDGAVTNYGYTSEGTGWFGY